MALATSFCLVCVLFALAPQPSIAGGRPTRELPVIRDPEEQPSVPSATNEAGAGGDVSNDPYATVALLNDVLFAPNVMQQKDEDAAEHWMVYFCPTWWEPCRKLLQPFALQSAEWQGRLNDGLMHNQVRFARVDCASHKPLCNLQGVANYPTAQHYYRGKLVASWAANGRNDGKRLVKWLSGQLEAVPAASTVLGKAADPRLVVAKYVTTPSNDRLVDFVVLLAILGLSFRSVCQNPDIVRKASVRAVARAPSVAANGATDATPRADMKLSGVARFLPEDWMLAHGCASGRTGLEL